MALASNLKSFMQWVSTKPSQTALAKTSSGEPNLRGRKKVENDLGLILIKMNLTNYW